MVEPGLGASTRQARRMWAKAQDVIVGEARQLQGAGVVEDMGKAHGLMPYVLPLKAHDPRTASVESSEAQRVDLPRVRDRDRPRARRRVEQQLHQGRRAAAVSQADTPAGVVDDAVKAQHLATGDDLSLGLVDGLVMRAKSSILSVEDRPHSQRVWGATRARPSARHAHPRAVR